MKRLIYITYLSLLVLILISCQKENVVPAGAPEEFQAESARIYQCNSYSYNTKTGPVNLGSVKSDVILVIFEQGISSAQRQAILTSYQIFRQTESEFFTDSGDTIQVLRLKPNATCNSVETMLASLDRNNSVKFAMPVFSAPVNSGLVWIGQTHEFLVTLANPNHYSKLLKLAAATKTTIVDDWGGGLYMMKINPNSIGNTLEVCSYFNSLSYISIAEPNFLMQGPVLKQRRFSEVINPVLAATSQH